MFRNHGAPRALRVCLQGLGIVHETTICLSLINSLELVTDFSTTSAILCANICVFVFF